MSNKRPSSPSSPTAGSSESSLGAEAKRARPSSAAPISLHSWLHPSAPTPLIGQSPALHSSSSTFLSFSISFEPSSGGPITIASEGSLVKEAKRVVRELDVVRMVGEGLLQSKEGAFQGGEGRAASSGLSKGKERAREPDHRMWAVRTLGLKEGRDGTKGEDDYQLLESSHDDGEKFGGERVLKTLRKNSGVDVLTVCCRWYGGEMIGPIRFHHIGVTVQTSLKNLLKLVALRDLRTALESLDEEIASLRAALADLASMFADSGPGPGATELDAEGQDGGRAVKGGVVDSGKEIGRSNTANDANGKYDGIEDLTRLERLVKAKEKTRDTLQAKLGTVVS